MNLKKNQEHRPEHIFDEKERIGRRSQIREIIFGAQDGLLVPLGVVSSVAGAFLSNHIVIVAGISEALAGAFSMAAGAYLSSQAQRQVHIAEIEKEKNAIKTYPEDEHEEMVLLFEKEGLSRENAEVVANKLAGSEKSFFTTMVQKELGLEPEPPGAPVKDAAYIGLSYLVASIIPIFPYFFLPPKIAIFYSIFLTLAALFALGIIKAHFANLPYFKSGLTVMLIGSLAGVGGYFLGNLLPRLLGIN